MDAHAHETSNPKSLVFLYIKNCQLEGATDK